MLRVLLPPNLAAAAARNAVAVKIESASGPAPAPELLPALIVCPTSLVENWAREAQQFTPGLKSLIISGSRHMLRLLAARLDGMDRQQLRTLADSLRNKWKSAVVMLASVDENGVAIVCAVTKDLTGKVQAGKLAAATAWPWRFSLSSGV